MNIVSLNYADLAGLSYNLCAAINELTNHHATHVAIRPVYIKYPAMVLGMDAIHKKIHALIRDADVVHINQRPELVQQMGVNLEDCRNKKIIFHSLGTRFRERSIQMLKQMNANFPGFTHTVATPDLFKFAPNATWFPNIVPVEHYRKTYPMRRNVPPILFTSPSKLPRTHPMFENTATTLKAEGFKFKSQSIKRAPHIELLKVKSKADIYYDGLFKFYGNNALEASSFELAVICGVNQRAKTYLEEVGVDCPFLNPYLTTVSEAMEEIRHLISDVDYRLQRGKEAYLYAKRMHGQEVGVKRFLELVK